MTAARSTPTVTYYQCDRCGHTDKKARPPAAEADGEGRTCPYVQAHGGKKIRLLFNRKASTSFFRVLQCPECGYVLKVQKGGPRRRHWAAEDYSAR